MPYNRNAIDVIKDVLTSPARLDTAFWEGLDQVFGDRSAGAVWNVLFNPTAANPDDLKTFAERIGIQNGVAKFAVDLLTSPTALTAMTYSVWAKNSIGLGLARGLSPAAEKYGEEMAVKNVGLLDHIITPTTKLLMKIGMPKSARADLLATRRFNGVMDQYIREYDAIKATFGDNTAWRRSMDTVFRLADGQGVPATELEQKAAAALHDRIFDPLFDRVGTTQSHIGRDVKSTGFISSYIPHLPQGSEDDFLALSAKKVRKWLSKNPIYRQGVAAGKLPEFPVSAEESINSLTAQQSIAKWMQHEGVARIFNPYLKERSSSLALGADDLMYDLDKIVNSYIHKAGRTIALHTPLDKAEALWLAGTQGADMKRLDWVAQNAVPTDELQRIHAGIRAAVRAGDDPLANSLRMQATAFTRQMTQNVPEQASLGSQISREFMDQIPGWRPGMDAAQKAKFMEGMRHTDKIKVRIAEDYFNRLAGKHELRYMSLATAYSNVMATMLPGIEKAATGLNSLHKGLGDRLINWITNSMDSRHAAELERRIVGYTTMNALGFRLMPLLVNLTQPWMVTGPTIGFGNLLDGIADGVPKLGRAYMDAFKAVKANKVPFRDALHDAFEKHLPEYARAGIPRDYHGMEAVFNEATREGFNPNNIASKVLFPFEASETVNRVISFYGARNMWRKSLARNSRTFGADWSLMNAADQDELLNMHSAAVVGETQFVPSEGRLTYLQNKLGPGLRQFSTYPIGFLNYLMDLGTKGAIDVKAGLLGRQIADTYGPKQALKMLPWLRYAAVSAGMVNFSEDVLGLNLGQKVLEGSVNLPMRSDGPFGMLPVPPIPGALLSYPMSALDGKLDKLNMVELPGYGTFPFPKLFTPAGIQVSSMSRLYNQTHGGMMLDDKGRGIQEVTPRMRWMTLLGLSPVESRRDYEKAKRLLYVSDKVKNYRRGMAQALAVGDVGKARQFQQQYASEFKDGPPLSVDQTDIDRILDQQRTTRLQRIATSVGSRIRGIVDPGLDTTGMAQLEMLQPGLTGGLPAGIMAR